MAQTAGADAGLLDLEDELTCSICTEVLYQPLTLLDCLHTFCGSCLKQWFSWQAVDAHPGRTYSCPSCRAVVRETKPSATVTTLLEMFIQANPARRKSEDEKRAIEKIYKPGDKVLPDTQNVDSEVLSSGRDRRFQDREGRSSRYSHSAARAGSTSRNLDNRQIAHQSSLRSLLSTSRGDSSALEDEILRQIVEDGLLDGINLDELDISQEDELSERIAEAYRRRHGSRRRHHSRASSGRSSLRPASQHSLAQQEPDDHSSNFRSRHARSKSATTTRSTAAGYASHHRRHTGSRTSPRNSRSFLGSDLNDNADAPRPRLRRSSEHRRSISRADQINSTSSSRRTRAPEEEHADPDGVVENEERTDDDAETLQSVTHGPVELDSKPAEGFHSVRNGSVTTINEEEDVNGGVIINLPLTTSPTSIPAPLSIGRQKEDSSVEQDLPEIFKEPWISCENCGKSHIEHEVHVNCRICKDGDYNLCLRCYRMGFRCLFPSFAEGTIDIYQVTLPFSTLNISPLSCQHDLQSRKYCRPDDAFVREDADGVNQTFSSKDPNKRLQTGKFCDKCLELANDCYWKCDQCNDGSWGFCNRCVNKGQCCTHPLLRVVEDSSLSLESEDTADPSSPICDACRQPVTPDDDFLHCNTCNDGDYNLCMACYARQIARGRVMEEDGLRGWRRCLKGHRMAIIGFRECGTARKRVIVDDLVGGLALEEGDASTDIVEDWSWRDMPNGPKQTRKVSRAMSIRTTDHYPNGSSAASPFPPEGAVGMRVLALWGYYPDEGVKDELMFPKGAEIGETEDINGDWFWGCYAGAKGLFPGNYVRILE